MTQPSARLAAAILASPDGAAAAFAARRAEVERWFASATFTSLR